MYNRDPDSLAEYEFKIGSYVSFDGGRSWTDLGQTGVCPPEQAPPSSWPNNVCYPDEDPARDGNGAEDGEGGTDFGEEYITSDAWVQFDDEGNAYLMVLDNPAGDAGWGMSFHRWLSPSPQDVESGNTWENRISINQYEQPLSGHFLDDKNTFAVNNAGPDSDGRPGTMVACWGQNITTAIKQQIVCESSTDGGRSWPGNPIPISGVQQLVIGVHVVADNVDPNTFYAVWLHYATGIVGAPEEMWFARTVDGGRTWTPPALAAQLTGVPRQFPGQNFRNLSIPIMATGPASGQLYIVYADYRPARTQQDEDGRQADIVLIKSANGGLTWSAPSVVNTDGTDGDQFQPYVAVTPAGQVNVVYFDRRHDPNNFYIDTYLSRSNDQGSSFTDVRLSHDMWDPSINPPISGSGEFIGDYQGLAVDDCNAIPFVNDTHLANDRSRDPKFDPGLRRSELQEVFSWRVPNKTEFGGKPIPDVGCET